MKNIQQLLFLGSTANCKSSATVNMVPRNINSKVCLICSTVTSRRKKKYSYYGASLPTVVKQEGTTWKRRIEYQWTMRAASKQVILLEPSRLHADGPVSISKKHKWILIQVGHTQHGHDTIVLKYLLRDLSSTKDVKGILLGFKKELKIGTE